MESRYFRLDQRKPKIHPLRILCAASCIGAVQISFPFSCALFNPLLSSFGMSSYLQPIMWLVGPLCGVLQPLIGAYNDQSNSKWGRRRPLIVTGLLLCLAGFFLFELVVFVSRGWSIGMGLVAFFLLNISNNMLGPPCRAIVFDFCGDGQQTMGSHFVALFIGVGNLLAFAVVALLQDAYAYGMGLVVFLALPTLLFAKEQPFYTPRDPNGAHPMRRMFGAIKVVLKNSKMRNAALLYMANWAAYFCFMPIATQFVAEGLYGQKLTGHVATMQQTDPLYAEGLQMGSFAMMASSLSTALFSAVATPITKFFGTTSTYLISQLLATLSFIAFFIPTTFGLEDSPHKWLWLIFVGYTALSFNYSLFNAIPFAMVAEAVPSFSTVGADGQSGRDETGVYAGVLNIPCILGQAVSLVIQSIISSTIPIDKETEKFKNRGIMQWQFLGEACLSFVVCILVVVFTKGVYKRQKLFGKQ